MFLSISAMEYIFTQHLYYKLDVIKGWAGLNSEFFSVKEPSQPDYLAIAERDRFK